MSDGRVQSHLASARCHEPVPSNRFDSFMFEKSAGTHGAERGVIENQNRQFLLAKLIIYTVLHRKCTKRLLVN